MFRSALPAAFAALAAPLAAEALADCTGVPFSTDNCVRALACIGFDGLYFDGQVRGWNSGTISGTLSTGETCTGAWAAGGALGTGTAGLTCDNGLTADVIYYSLDNETGTAIGRGTTNAGVPVKAWSGEEVLRFLTPEGAVSAKLPCGTTPIPIS